MEDRWDSDVEKELKEGTNIIAAEKNDVVAAEIIAEMNDIVAKIVDKDDGNRMVVHPSRRDNPRNPSYNQSNSVSSTIRAETSSNALTNDETMAERPKTPIFNVYPRKKRSIITSPTPIVNLETSNENNDKLLPLYSSHKLSQQIPTIVQEALNSKPWKDALNEEIIVSKKNQTEEIVDLVEGKTPMDCKWIFTMKYKFDGSKERCKARLTVKWYTQTYGIDHHETFAPMAKMNTISLVVIKD